MDKYLEFTKSLFSIVGIVGLVSLSVITVNALNPKVGNSTNANNLEDKQIAGVVDYENTLPIEFEEVGGLQKIGSSTLGLTIEKETLEREAGYITLYNPDLNPQSVFLKALTPTSLDRVLRLELVDRYDTIILKDYNKEFEGQYITLNKLERRTFKVNYILKTPLNFSTSFNIEKNNL